VRGLRAAIERDSLCNVWQRRGEVDAEFTGTGTTGSDRHLKVNPSTGPSALRHQHSTVQLVDAPPERPGKGICGRGHDADCVSSCEWWVDNFNVLFNYFVDTTALLPCAATCWALVADNLTVLGVGAIS